MGNGRRIARGGTATGRRCAGTVSGTGAELAAEPPPGRSGRCCDDAELDACVQDLVDAAPPLTGEQRDALALLLRRPRGR
jgi:hypothetical protein